MAFALYGRLSVAAPLHQKKLPFPMRGGHGEPPVQSGNSIVTID